MKRNYINPALTIATFLLQVIGLSTATCRADQPTPAALDAFDSYIHKVEERLERHHASTADFLDGLDSTRLRRGELVIEEVMPNPVPAMPGAMLHDWRGTAFAPGAHMADFERIMRDYSAYPRYFSPQVLTSRILRHLGDHYQVLMRVKQKHVLTVVLDTTYDVQFRRLDSQHGYSVSRSTQISEIEHAGELDENALTAAQNHGFLWRLNTYWSYEERDGGLYLQIETVSLTRAIPPGLGWAIGPFVESVPKESLEFTLRAVCNALKKQ